MYNVSHTNQHGNNIMDHELRMHLAAEKRKEAAKAAMTALIDSTNIMGGENDVTAGIVEALAGTHRTLQQAVIRCFADSMKEYAKFNTDLRNAAAVDFAKKINDMEHHFPYI